MVTTSNARSSWGWILTSAIVVLIAARLVVIGATGDGYELTGDEGKYDGYAASLLERGEFISGDGQFRAWAPPLWPFLLSVVYRIAGDNYTAGRLFVSLIEVTTLLVLWLL